MALNLHLLAQYIVSDLLPGLPDIRTPAEHTFIAHYTNGKVVNGYPVVLPAHNLRSHVAGRTTRILCILRGPHSCNSKVC